jgi:hypothetical protein
LLRTKVCVDGHGCRLPDLSGSCPTLLQVYLRAQAHAEAVEEFQASHAPAPGSRPLHSGLRLHQLPSALVVSTNDLLLAAHLAKNEAVGDEEEKEEEDNEDKAKKLTLAAWLEGLREPGAAANAATAAAITSFELFTYVAPSAAELPLSTCRINKAWVG